MVILSLFNATPAKDIEAVSQGVQVGHSRYWTVKEMLNLALDAGFDTTQASNIVAIALAESGGFDGAQNYNPPDVYCPNGSLDRGVLQFNSCYHAEIPDACAYDARCSFENAYRVSHGGMVYNEWYAYVKGTYLSFLGLVIDTLAEKLGEEFEVDP